MARYWKEKLDVEKHVDYMKTYHVGGFSVGDFIGAPLRDNLNEHWVYFIHVCSFTFHFQSLRQIEEYLGYFSQKIHPSSMVPNVNLEHYWQNWQQRFPYWLFEEPKRKRVVQALQRASNSFEKQAKASSINS